MTTSITSYKKTSETKVMRDPVHSYIQVDEQIIWDLINAPEFQRLRRIHQLGGTFQVYHGAEHSRFSHSLGVYELVRQMVERIKGLREALSEQEYIALLCSGLLHDIGHGPFSHAFESVTAVNHEVFTERIILEESRIHQILVEADPDLPKIVADIIGHRHERELLTQIISSQLDADRMDYLLRDSYETGVSYGEFDLYRILRTMRIVEDRLVVKESGIHAIEDYIMARYQMYWQVYLHPTSRSFEVLLHAAFSRMKALYKKNDPDIKYLEVFIPFLKDDKEVSLHNHFILDEAACMAGFMTLRYKAQDPILRDLSRRLLDRDLLAYTDYDESTYALTRENAQKQGYDPDSYVIRDSLSQKLYENKPYAAKDDKIDERIMVLTPDGELKELSTVSEIVKGFVSGATKKDEKLFYPKEIVHR